MKNVLLGAVLGAGLTATAVVWWNSANEAHAQQRAGMGQIAAGELITHHAAVDDHRHQLTIVDPQLRAACVYHIDRDTGEISLKSARHFQWDLQLGEFNSSSPRPRDIRAMLDQQ